MEAFQRRENEFVASQAIQEGPPPDVWAREHSVSAQANVAIRFTRKSNKRVITPRASGSKRFDHKKILPEKLGERGTSMWLGTLQLCIPPAVVEQAKHVSGKQ
jgi:hypothetical protein